MLSNPVTLQEPYKQGGQGGCLVGEYFYQVHVLDEASNLSQILKYDLQGNVVSQSAEDLPLYHANDMTYNSRLNKLLVNHGSGDYKTVSLIDPETLVITGTLTAGCNVAALAYNETYDCYAATSPGTHYIYILDGDLQVTKCYNTIKTDPIAVSTAITGQGITCDDNYIYCVLYDSANKVADSTTTQVHAITVFDWNGKRVKEIAFSLSVADMKNEPENISIVGNTIYMEINVAPGVNKKKYSGNYLYSFDLETN